MTIKVSAVENEIGRVKCYQSKRFGGVQSLEESTYIPLEGLKFLCTPHTEGRLIAFVY